ncbi:MAG: RDD family protein [Pseudomonadota bacterium]
MTVTDNDKLPNAALWRRLAAMLYDALLLIAVLMIATFIMLPFNGGEAIVGNWLFSIYVFLVGCGFFALFWRFGGQTLGMRAWRLQVRGASGGTVTWREAWIRSLVALLSWLCGGLGFLWSLVDKDRRAWHDMVSGTRLIVIPKRRDPRGAS